MNEQTTEKFASLLGAYATTGNSAGLQKEAAENGLIKSAISSLMYMPLIGAGIGGASGYLGTSGKEKQKQRNALYGALTGGLGGFAGAALTPVVREMFSAKSDPAAPAADTAGKKDPPGSVYGGPNSTPLGGAAVGAAGAAGIYGGQRAGGQLYDRITKTTPHTDELKRLAEHKPPAAAKGGKGSPANPYAGLRELLERHRPVSAGGRGEPIVGPGARRAQDIINTGAVNNDPRRAKVVERLLAEQAARTAATAGPTVKPKPTPSGTLLGDIKPHAKSTLRRNVARGAGGGLGAVGASAITNLLGRILGNAVDRTVGNVPATTKQEK